MRPGDTIRVVKGEHQGQQGLVRGAEGWYYHVELLTTSGRKPEKKLVSLHRSMVVPAERF